MVIKRFRTSTVILTALAVLFVVGIIGTFGPTITSEHIGPTTTGEVDHP